MLKHIGQTPNTRATVLPIILSGLEPLPGELPSGNREEVTDDTDTMDKGRDRPEEPDDDCNPDIVYGLCPDL